VRRALLTAGRSAGPVTVGNSAGPLGTSISGRTAAYSLTNPATGTATLTSATVFTGTAVAVYFFSVDPATMTVRAVSGTVTTTGGAVASTHAISLPIVAGDYIGVAAASGTATFYAQDGAGGGAPYSTSARPVAGDSVSAFTALAGYNLRLSATA